MNNDNTINLSHGNFFDQFMENNDENENNDIVCAICQENLDYNRRLPFVSSCGHSFHKMCFNKLPVFLNIESANNNFSIIDCREPIQHDIKNYYYSCSVKCPCCRAAAKPTNIQMQELFRQRIQVEKRMFKEKKNYRDQDICETKQTIQNLKRKINYYKENLKKIKLRTF